jgi:hypothetical protein
LKYTDLGFTLFSVNSGGREGSGERVN